MQPNDLLINQLRRIVAKRITHTKDRDRALALLEELRDPPGLGFPEDRGQ